MAFRVLLVGGGSGGHVYPLVAVGKALLLRGKDRDTQVKLMGDGPFIKRAGEENGIPYKVIMAPKLRRYSSAANVTDWLKAPFALWQSLWNLFWFMPDAVFAKGGYTSAFPVLVARLYRIPVYLHESDSVPGLANRTLARRARLIFTAFESAQDALQGYPTMLVGNPVRRALAGVDRASALRAFKFVDDKPTVLIIGGSQGAMQLNEVLINTLVEMVTAGYQIIHQCGDTNYKEMSERLERIAKEGAGTYGDLIVAQYRLYGFLNESQLAAAYTACDIAVTRASANVLTELAYLGKPMVIVPLATAAQNHQVHNAAELLKYGNSIIQGVNITPHILLGELKKLLEPDTYQRVSTSVRAFAKEDAAEKIADVILQG